MNPATMMMKIYHSEGGEIMAKQKSAPDGKCFTCSNFKKRMSGNAEAIALCEKCIKKQEAK